MLSLTSKLLINSKDVKGMSGCSITSNLNPGMDEATVVIAAGKIKPSDFKEGQTVDISLGYSRYGLMPEFSGIITSISPRVPVELKCCDLFYKLRQKRINRSFHRVSLANIIRQAAEGFTVVTDDEAGSLMISAHCPGKTARAFIIQLARDHGYLSFFRDGKLNFIKPESLEKDDNDILYQEGVNIIEDHLYYHRSQSIDKVTVYSETEYGYLSQASYGKGKNEYPVHIEGGIGASQCWKRAKEIYLDLNYEGFKGDLKTFGYPYVRAGMYCTLVSANGEKSGVFRADKVETEFSGSGFRRTLLLGIKHKTKQAPKNLTGRKAYGQ